MMSLERLYGRQRYRVRKAAGLCRCGLPRSGGRATCEVCYARGVDRRADERANRSAGLCPCGARPRGGRTTCDACYARNRGRNARHRARKAVRR